MVTVDGGAAERDMLSAAAVTAIVGSGGAFCASVCSTAVISGVSVIPCCCMSKASVADGSSVVAGDGTVISAGGGLGSMGW